MAAAAGRLIALKVSGEGVAMTGEATTATVANKVYRITAAAKRVWDATAEITVNDDGSPVDAESDPYTIDRLAGTVTFASTASRTITIDGTYLPLSTLAGGHGFSFKCEVATATDTEFLATDVTRQAMQRDCSGSIEQWYDVDSYLLAAFDAGLPFILEFSPDGGTTPRLRARVFPTGDSVDGDRLSFLNSSVSFVGAADVDGRSFTWM